MSGLRKDLARLQTKLDALDNGAVVLDADGDAWQKGFPGFWYRAFGDSSQVSSFQLAQIARKAIVLHEGTRR